MSGRSQLSDAERYMEAARIAFPERRNLQEEETERHEFIRRFSGHIRQARVYLSKVFGDHPLGGPQVAQTCRWSHCPTPSCGDMGEGKADTRWLPAMGVQTSHCLLGWFAARLVFERRVMDALVLAHSLHQTGTNMNVFCWLHVGESPVGRINVLWVCAFI